MGRPERPIDPDADMIQQFAGELRRLRKNAGGPPYRQLASRTGYSVTALSEAAGGRRFPSLPLTLAYVRACGASPSEWETRWRTVDEALARRIRERSLGESSPYLGLSAFQPGDASRFFGREALVTDLVAKVRDRPFLAVFGPSGSGKSSLLRAGLVAAAGSAVLPGDWLTALCTPGEHPPRQVAAALASLLGLPTDTVAAGLAADPEVETSLLSRMPAGRPDARLLLVVDQFEEIFTLCRDHDERTDFVRILHRLAHTPGGRVRVVVGVRADFFTHCAEHPELIEALRDASVLVGPMTAAELTRAITKPAHQAGISVDRALVTAIIRDAAREPGALPLVSHVLLQTWLHRRGDSLTLAGYEAVGAVHGALARTAEQVYTAMPPQHQATARRIFMRLVTLGDGVADTRRRVTHAELASEGGTTDAVVERLVQARLLIRDGDAVQLAHEALIRAWPRLDRWLSEDRAGLRTHRQLTEAAGTWEALGREAGSLYRGSRLEVTREWAGEDGHDARLTAAERQFLDASIAVACSEERAARKGARLLRGLVGALAVLSVLSLTMSGVAIRQRQTAQSRELAAESRIQAKLDVPGAARLALRAYEKAPTVQARGALLSIASHPTYHARLLGHRGEVKTLAFTRDNRILATGGQDRTVILWDTVQRSQLAVLHGQTGSVRALAISHDGHLLATAGRDGNVLLWDLDRRVVLRTLTGHRGILDGVAFSPDGRLLASAGVDQTTIIWEVATGAIRSRLSGYGGQSTEVAFSPDGRTVATADDNGNVALWDLSTRRARVLKASPLPVLALAFSPGGRLLATGGQDLTIALWDLPTGRRVNTLRGHIDPVRGLTFSPEGEILISAGYDRQANLWDVTSGGLISSLAGPASALYAVAVSPNTRYISAASADGTVLLWDRHRMPLIGHTGWASAVSFSHDGKLIATGGNDTTARIWDPETRQARTVMTASPLRTGPAPETQNPSVESVAFDPEDQLLATGGDDGSIRLWEVPGGRQADRLEGHQERVTAVTFSPDGRLLASAGGTDGTVRLWDIRGSDPPQLLQSTPADIESVVFSPDGRLLLSAGLDQKISVWDVARRSLITTLNSPSAVQHLAISPDGRTLATANANGNVTLWNLADRRIVGTLVGHQAKLRAVAFSPDGRLLASGGLDQEVILWDISRRTRWATLTGHTDLVLDLAFSPDSATLASASADHTVTTWITDPEQAKIVISTGKL